MPSSVGHALAGVAAGLLIHGPGSSVAARDPANPAPVGRIKRQALRLASFYALIAIVPDLDLLFGTHSARSHSIGAAAGAGLVVALASGPPMVRRGVAAACAYATHVLLDWLGNDGTAPIGIMALWPFTNAYYQSDLHLFMAISRQPWWEHFWIHNLTAVVREILIVGPIALAVLWWKGRGEQERK